MLGRYLYIYTLYNLYLYNGDFISGNYNIIIIVFTRVLEIDKRGAGTGRIKPSFLFTFFSLTLIKRDGRRFHVIILRTDTCWIISVRQLMLLVRLVLGVMTSSACRRGKIHRFLVRRVTARRLFDSRIRFIRCNSYIIIFYYFRLVVKYNNNNNNNIL